MWSLSLASVVFLAMGIVASLRPATHMFSTGPPVVVGTVVDVGRILAANVAVLALHAAIALGIADGILMQREQSWLISRGSLRAGVGRLIVTVICAAAGYATFVEVNTVSASGADMALALRTSPGLVFLGVVPHAGPELWAEMLPIGAIGAYRHPQVAAGLRRAVFWATLAGLPVLLATSVWEVYVAPHVLRAIVGYP
jgi:hypothetical protein